MTPCWLTHGPTPSRPPASRHCWRAAQAAVRGDLPGLGERVAQHGGGRLRPAAGDRRPPGERLHHRDDPALAQGEVEPGGPLQRPGQQVRPGAGRADDEHRLPHLPAVDDQDVRPRRLRGRAGRPGDASAVGTRAVTSARAGGPGTAVTVCRARRGPCSARRAAVRARVLVQVERGLDQRHVAERLRRVADLALVPGVVLLAEQADVVAQREQPLEQLVPPRRPGRSCAARWPARSCRPGTRPRCRSGRPGCAGPAPVARPAGTGAPGRR